MGSLFKKIGSIAKAELQDAKQKSIRRLEKFQKQRQELRKSRENKFKLVDSLTNTELMRVAKRYISSNPKIRIPVLDGKDKFRSPTRQELIDAILSKVSTSNILAAVPRAKPKQQRILKAKAKKSSSKKKTKSKKK